VKIIGLIAVHLARDYAITVKNHIAEVRDFLRSTFPLRSSTSIATISVIRPKDLNQPLSVWDNRCSLSARMRKLLAN
jgi:hypothetical protein